MEMDILSMSLSASVMIVAGGDHPRAYAAQAAQKIFSCLVGRCALPPADFRSPFRALSASIRDSNW